MDGVDVVDSQLALEYLGRKFGKEVLGLSALDKALARSLRIVMEDHLNWVLLIDRYIDREEGRRRQSWRTRTWTSYPWS